MISRRTISRSNVAGWRHVWWHVVMTWVTHVILKSVNYVSKNAQNKWHMSPRVKNTRWHRTRQLSTLIYKVVFRNFGTPELHNFRVKRTFKRLSLYCPSVTSRNGNSNMNCTLIKHFTTLIPEVPRIIDVDERQDLQLRMDLPCQNTTTNFISV